MSRSYVNASATPNFYYPSPYISVCIWPLYNQTGPTLHSFKWLFHVGVQSNRLPIWVKNPQKQHHVQLQENGAREKRLCLKHLVDLINLSWADLPYRSSFLQRGGSTTDRALSMEGKNDVKKTALAEIHMSLCLDSDIYVTSTHCPCV